MAKNSDSFPIFALQKRIYAMKLFFLTLGLLALAVLMLGVKVFFVKGGKFPSGHVKDVPQLRKKNIGCAAHDE